MMPEKKFDLNVRTDYDALKYMFLWAYSTQNMSFEHSDVPVNPEKESIWIFVRAQK